MRGLPSLPRTSLQRHIVAPLRSQSSSSAAASLSTATTSTGSAPRSASGSGSSLAPPPRPRVTFRDRRAENRRKVLQNLAFNASSTLVTEGARPKHFRPSTTSSDPAPSIDDPSPPPAPLISVPPAAPRLKTNQFSYAVPSSEFEEFDREIRDTSRFRIPKVRRSPVRNSRRVHAVVNGAKSHHLHPKLAAKPVPIGTPSARHPLPIRRPTWKEKMKRPSSSAQLNGITGTQEPLRLLPNTLQTTPRALHPGQRYSPSQGRASPPVHLLEEPRVLQLGEDTKIEVHRGFLLLRRQVDVTRGSLSRSEPITRIIPFPRLKELCDCPKCIDPSTKQRALTSGEQYHMVKKAGFLDGVPGLELIRVIANNLLEVNWEGPKAHPSTYSLDRLQTGMDLETQQSRYLSKTLRRRLWDRADSLTASTTLRVPYTDIFSDQGVKNPSMLTLLEHLQVYGIVILTGVPTEQTDNDTCTLKGVAGSIGEIRHTFYGQTWNVKSVKNSKNVAYTNLNLGVHMDLLYFSNPPRFQLLHCLRNRVEGGASYFLDSFAVAEKFMKLYPAEADLLAGHLIEYEYDNDGHYLNHRHPILPRNFRSIKSAINWSPPFQGTQHTFSPVEAHVGKEAMIDSVQYEYRVQEAITIWESFLNDTKRRYTFTMNEGDLVLFDNRRVLHARTAFRDFQSEEERINAGAKKVNPGEASRWLKGCYLDGEVVWDKLVALKWEQDKVKRQEGDQTE